MAGRIVGGATPIHSTCVAWKNDGAFERRRSENSLGARCGDFFRAPFFALGSKSKSILRRQAFRKHGNAGRLRGPGFFAFDVCFWNRFFFHGNERGSVETVKDKDAAHLCGDGDGGSVVFPIEENRLRGDVVVPKVVMNNLEAPNE